MISFLPVLLLPAALLLDRLLGDPAVPWHPARLMGLLAEYMENFFRQRFAPPPPEIPAQRTPAGTSGVSRPGSSLPEQAATFSSGQPASSAGLECPAGTSGVPFSPDSANSELSGSTDPQKWRLRLAGILAALCVALPCILCAALLSLIFSCVFGVAGSWFVAVLCVYICMAPRSLAEHALRVSTALESGDLPSARRSVGMIVGRQTADLDEHGVARACIESVAENSTDGVFAPLFWAGAGFFLGGILFSPASSASPGGSLSPEQVLAIQFTSAAICPVLHRAFNVLDAMWGKRNSRYRFFGTSAARFDDFLNFLPARLALPCIALAARSFSPTAARSALSVGWRYRHSHESPNSAWSEAAFAGALALRLGGPARYGALSVQHPWLGNGDTHALPRHIRQAVTLMWRSTGVFMLLMEIIIC